jgi:hypothetical protein
MSRETKPNHGSTMEMELSGIVQKLSKRVGRGFYRAIIYSEGRVELEFEAPNPWECLVIRAEGWAELLESFEQEPNTPDFPKEAVIRKKCMKCFLHERRAAAAELRYKKT